MTSHKRNSIIHFSKSIQTEQNRLEVILISIWKVNEKTMSDYSLFYHKSTLGVAMVMTSSVTSSKIFSPKDSRLSAFVCDQPQINQMNIIGVIAKSMHDYAFSPLFLDIFGQNLSIFSFQAHQYTLKLIRTSQYYHTNIFQEKSWLVKSKITC